MSTTTEPIVVLKWLHSVLTTDSVLTHATTGVLGGFHGFPLPAGLRSPFGMVRQHTAAVDLTALNNGGLIWVPTTFQVNLYDRERRDFARLDPLAARVYAVLHGAVATTAGGIIFSVHRTQIDADAENLGDVVEQFITQHFAITAVAAA